MPAFTLIPASDPDPIDRDRACDLASAGLPGYCATVAVGIDGEEYILLVQYEIGVADGRVLNWHAVAPHEDLGLQIYHKP